MSQLLSADEIVKLAADIHAASSHEQFALILEEMAKAVRASENDASVNVRMKINKWGEVYWQAGNDLFQLQLLFQNEDL